MDARDAVIADALCTTPDAISVKPTETGKPGGYDAGKSIMGRKRRITTNTHGFLVGVIVIPSISTLVAVLLTRAPATAITSP
jgi:hypothetical protein